jgi:hypothetical protein
VLLLLPQMVYEGIPYLPLSWRDRQLKASMDAAKVRKEPFQARS